MGSAHGVIKEKIDALADYATSPLYDEAERVALSYADAMTVTGREVSDEQFARLREFYNDDEIIELTAIGSGSHQGESMSTVIPMNEQA